MNRLLIVVVASAAVGICGQGAVAGTLHVVHSIDLPRGRGSSDLAWDGQHLWTSMNPGRGHPWSVTYELDPSDGSVLSSFRFSDEFNLKGHTWDGNHLWIARMLANADNVPYGTPPDVLTDHVYKLTTEGMLVSTFSGPYGADAITTGAAWDGAYLWLSDSKHREIMQVDPLDMTIMTSFASAGTQPRGLTWDGSYLWSVDQADDMVYQMDTSGNVVETWAAPAVEPYGITFDGQYLWILDNDARKVFQVAMAEPSTLVLLTVAGGSLLALLCRRRWLESKDRDRGQSVDFSVYLPGGPTSADGPLWR